MGIICRCVTMIPSGVSMFAWHYVATKLRAKTSGPGKIATPYFYVRVFLNKPRNTYPADADYSVMLRN